MRHALIGCLAFVACGKPVVPAAVAPAPWQPGTVLRLDRTPNARGYVELRGLVHVHSIYSHDACDGAAARRRGRLQPELPGRLPHAACAPRKTTSSSSPTTATASATNEFPGVLLFDGARGDALVERGGAPTANWLACPGRGRRRW